MYIIIVYDVNVDRVNKVNKFLKAYLHWQQNSVFEGKVTKSQYNEIIDKLNKLTGISRAYLFDLENNRKFNPTLAMLEKRLEEEYKEDK